jgi:23S rRNA pseudouridine2605 synthase
LSTEGADAYPLRLQKFLARAGLASRRGSEALISAGRVKVNGELVCELGRKIDPQKDEVRVDGRLVVPASDHCYLILNKPAGYLTTMADPQKRPVVRELVPVAEHPGLFPVGRLDFQTTGLLLFTTDGELAHRLLHPSRHVLKRYVARVEGQLSERQAASLRFGVLLDDGPTKPAELRIIDVHQNQANVITTVELAISEGRKRQVRRMLAHVGRPVISLNRISFGPLLLDDLASGTWRYLSDEEVSALRDKVRDKGDGTDRPIFCNKPDAECST